MLFFDIFENSARWILSGLAFLFLAFSTFYVRKLKVGHGLLLLLGGLALVFATSLLQSYTGFFYEHAVSAQVLTLAEMLLVLTSAVLLIMASSWILMNTALNVNVLFAFVSVGLVLILYAIFIANDANIVGNIRQILPIIGMTYVFLSLVSRSHIWRCPGEMTAALAIAGLIVLMIWPMLFVEKYAWYVPVDLIVLLGFSYYLLYQQELRYKILRQNEVRRRMSQNIENIIKSSPFPIIISRLSDDTLLMANNNAIKLFGLTEEQLPRYHFKDFLVDADNRKILTERLEKSKEVHDFEILVKTATGNTPFWLLASVNIVDYNNDVVLYSAFQDITARKRRESMLQSQADRDPLTSVFNRRYFENKAEEKISQAHLQKESFAVLMLDADFFKNINDAYGHKAGDKVLMELAAICERSLRPEDMVARYGGEEFVVFLSKVTPEIAEMVANRLRESISNAVVYSDDGRPVRFTVSIGVAPSGIADDINLMIKMADDAMYQAKENGRNRVELYDNNTENNKKTIKPVHQNKARMIHPAFSQEDNQEISLLDGIETNHMVED